MGYSKQRFLVIAILLLFAPLTANAFGVSPPNVNADRLVPGVHYETTVVLSRGQPTENLKAKAVFDVPEKIRSWFSLDLGEEFLLPKGVQQIPVKVIIDVPKKADFGQWNGYLRISTMPERKEGQQVIISEGVRVDISLQVGDNIIADFVIKKIEILDIREGDPPKIKITIENTGNVPIAPDRATFDLFDKYGNVRLGFAQTEEIKETPAFKTANIIVKFPLDIKLGIGEYWGETKIYRGDQVVKELKTVFDVTEKNLISDIVDFVKARWLIIGAVLGGIILVLLAFFILRRRFLRR